MFFLIIGLGNPGEHYRESRHNVGFRALNRLAQRHGVTWAPNRFSAEVGTGSIAGRKVWLIKPMTFMNLSGASVAKAQHFFKTSVEQLLVLHDDVDLQLGRLQVRQGGGHGGHRGVRSVAETLGDPGFGRIRMGVGRPSETQNTADYVLGRFTPPEFSLVDDMVGRAVEAVEVWLAQGLTAAMNRFNRRTGKEQEEA